MSAISLSSVEEPSSANYATYADSTHRQRQISPQTNYSQQTYASTAQAPQASYQRQPVPDRTTTGRSNGNGIAAPNPQTKTVFQRARTYSSPYGSDATNSHANGRPKPTAKSTDPARSLSPRPVDIKPTRIPKASRTPVSVASSSTGSPYTNGSSHDPVVAPFSLSPEPSDQIAAQRGIITSSSTQTTVDLPSRSRHTPVLLNESPPFPTDTTMSSGFTQRSATRNAPVEEAPPRPSTDSEERPYEHWYRGEASRNGGVGELRVGRRQEMLDIANYGHMIENRQAAKRMAPMDVQEDTPRARKRAGSIAGITNKERHRGSLYLDEDNIDEAGRVLDEHPLTDLDGEGSEVQSVSDAYDGGAYAYLPEVGDTPSTEWTTVAGAHERSITPTANSMLPRPSSRQQQTIYVPPTRIPGPSSRRSSESRSTVNSSPAVGGNTPIHFSGNTAMHVSKSSPSNSRQLNYLNNASPGSAQKRGGSPASRKGRGAAPKVVKSKTLPGKKGEDAKRGSVAYYPTPMGDEEDMADAIPSWTQPIPREGNWDDVSLRFHFPLSPSLPFCSFCTLVEIEPSPSFTSGCSRSSYPSSPGRKAWVGITKRRTGVPNRRRWTGQSHRYVISSLYLL